MITFKNIENRDQRFIEKLYRSTREKELNLTNWPEEVKHSFIIMQLTAQLADYKSKYPGATFQVILYKKKQAGRLYLWESKNDIHIIDISLLPEFQGKGIGNKILKELINSARQKSKMVSLYVIRDNPAKRLYQRLGFKKVSDNNMHEYMECHPG